MHALIILTIRNLAQHRSRTVLTALAVALGVAMTVAAGVTSSAIMNAMAESPDAQTLMAGLLDQLDGILTAVGMAITAAAGFLILNSFAMSVTQRKQQIGALRALGLTRRQTMALLLIEALIVGGAGTLLGLVAGPLLGRGTIALIKVVTGDGLFLFAAGDVSLAGLLLASLLGLGVSLLAVLVPAWQAARIPPLAALRELRIADCGLRIADCGLRIADCGLQIADCGLRIADCRLRIAICNLQSAIRFAFPLALLLFLAVAPPGAWVQPPWDLRLTIVFVLLWLIGLGLLLPVLIGGLGRRLRAPLAGLAGATGRLVADNVQRERGRVTMTALVLTVALALIVGLTGFFHFTFNELMLPRIESSVGLGAWIVAPFLIDEGMSAYSHLESLQLAADVVPTVRAAVGERAQLMEWHFAIVPELSFFGSTYFSLVVDPHVVQQGGETFFAFSEGDWQTAMPVMESGCGLLVAPLVAGRNGVGLGDTLPVSGANGPVTCTIAGIGSPYVGASLISIAAGDSFGIDRPIGLLVWPRPGVARADLEVELLALTALRPDIRLTELRGLAEMQMRLVDILPATLNSLLLLATVAAALGVVNTTVASVAERQHEFALLRAVGATRRQVTAVVVGEAALMGLAGGAMGLVAGAGTVVMIAVVYGGNGWGIVGLDLWGAAWRSLQPALVNGLVGVVVSPLICAGVAGLTVKRQA